MSRNILKSPNSFVAMTDSDTAFHETPTNLNLYNTVQSCNYSVGFPRQNLKQVGSQEFVSRDFFNQPDVQLGLSYIPDSSASNEAYGLFCATGVLDNFVNFLDGRLKASTNFYVFNCPNQQDDALADITHAGGAIDFSGYEIISFGNCFPTTYGLTYGVGALPVISTSYICSNMEYTLPTGTSGDSPAINLTGGNKDNAALQIFNFQKGTDKPRIANQNDPNSSITLQNLQVGGQVLSGIHFVQAVDMSVDLPRVSNYGLGSDFAYGRKAQLPANGKFSVSSLVSGFNSGELTGVLGSDSGYDFELVLAATGTTYPQQTKMIYQIEDARLVSYNYSMPVNNQMTFDAEFSFEVTETKGLKLSGSYYSDSWNPLAGAYISKVEENDGYMFSNAQKDALGEFFDALEVSGLHTKIKKMWFVGFSPDAGLRDVMNPTEMETWDTPPDAGDMNDGYATFNNENMPTSHTMSSLGIDNSGCGAFVSCSNMVTGTMNYLNAYESAGKCFQLSQRPKSIPEGDYRTYFRASNEFVTGDPNIINGVFVGTRNKNVLSRMTTVGAARVIDTYEKVQTQSGQTTSLDIDLWGGNTIGNVSSIGITEGLTEDESVTLGGIIYDACVGVGHTELVTLETYADAYITQVEANDSHTFTTPQKTAISGFFEGLFREDLVSKVKKMWLVGFSNEAALRNVINPTETEVWTEEPSIDPDGVGWAEYQNDAKMTLGATMSGIGIEHDDCGAFVSCTNMDVQESAYVSTWSSSAPAHMMQLKQKGSSTYNTHFRAGNTSFVGSTDSKQDGVFVASRKGSDVSVTRIYGDPSVASQLSTDTRGGGGNSSSGIYIWGGNTKGDVSTAGITLGLTSDETETLGGLLYDLCVGIGHTDLEYTTA